MRGRAEAEAKKPDFIGKMVFCRGQVVLFDIIRDNEVFVHRVDVFSTCLRLLGFDLDPCVHISVPVSWNRSFVRIQSLVFNSLDELVY